MKKSKVAGLAFTGCMFIGMGLGFFLDNLVGGMFIGMGVGFAFQAVVYLANSELFKENNGEGDDE